MIRNRDQWRIDTVHRNGDLTVYGRSGTVRLPADYVQDHVELAYPQTSHATQGRTVDRSILVLEGTADVRGIYVPMSRGRHHNDAYIVTTGEQTALDVFADSITRSWIDQPALARQAELASHNPHRPGTLPADELRQLLAERAQLSDTLAQLNDDLKTIPRDLRWANDERTSAIAALQDSRDRLQRARNILAEHDRPFRRRGHENTITNANQTIEKLPTKIDEHTSEVTAVEARISDLEQRLAQARQLDDRRPALETQLGDIDGRLGDDRRIRTRQLNSNTPERITDTLGVRPAGGGRAQAWDIAAGQLDQHQTAYDLTDGLGPSKGPKLSPGFLHSRSLAEGSEHGLDRAVARERQQTLERQGPALRIGR